MGNIVNQMLLLFLLMAAGFIADKCKVMNADLNRGLSKLVLNVTLPAMVLAAVLKADHSLETAQVFVLLGVAVGLYLFLIPLGYLFTKLLAVKDGEKGVYRYSFIFGNIGFMGFPVVAAIYAGDAVMAVFYASFFQLPFCFLNYTLGVHLMAGEDAPKRPLWKAALQPGVIVPIVGLALYLLNVSMPDVIVGTADKLGSITTPASMLIIGATVAEMPLKNVFVTWRLYPATVIKIAIVPGLFWALLRVLSLPLDPIMLGVAVIMAAMPTANSSTMLCHTYGGDAELAASSVVVTTIASVVGVPLLAWLLLGGAV
ncbi:MAG: AEC family transporter [Clostridia bacterium]|nr:AEC family transporter [Clostridia bacterium]